MRKTKIICTLGPSSESEETLRRLMIEGMDVARFNFSHGTHEEQLEKFNRVKRIREELGLPVAALLDTKGPEIRLKTFENDKAELKQGSRFTLTTREVLGNASIVSITYKDLPRDVKPGGRILLDDGLIELLIDDVDDTEIHCTVANSGVISNRKGVNVPDTNLSMPFISQKDYDDICFGIEHGFDFIAASFTRTAEDILQIRKILEEKNCNNISIIAKIENMQGVQNINDIIRVSDGIMVARGDMGVEIPLEEVPVLQKKIIRKVYQAGKQVITATQMLDSMMKNPRPTRAEATDVANAIYDGTSAIMLSGETAAGAYPVEALQTMVKIAERTEIDINYRRRFEEKGTGVITDVTNAISHATCTTGMDLNAAAIITVSKSGRTARMISKFRPTCPIIACTMSESVWRRLNLSWGVQPVIITERDTTDDLFETAVEAAQKKGYVKQGDITVITAGVPLGVSGTTNMLKVQVVGHILANGEGINKQKIRGRLCVCHSKEDLVKEYQPGDIVVTQDTDNTMLNQLKTASGIVIEKGSLDAHAVTVGLSLDIPVLLNVKNATDILKTGVFVTLDCENGVIVAD
ncbi:pyruvate kinase [Frisingicoccus sp.]|uniref:pyruvate kinase n=2 Tax=Frisingicoccus sp. TaxID=1918627 RepID=UPI002A816993|nr:pyruvate kinase [Frisingicoccus sp.]MDY4834842.1 pyruvate kinase [Frisingicoccus sp.]MDY4922757.1 pyruvate kinase [Frisingicoccus sp.]